MSRLVLKSELLLEGQDPATGHDIEYSSESGQLTIGCQMHSLAQWKRGGKAFIEQSVSESICRCSSCIQASDYPARLADMTKRSKAAVRTLLPRLEKLIATIERAESALKKSLRAQTKRT